MRKYGKVYLKFKHRPSKTDYEPGQYCWVDEVEAAPYLEEGQAVETAPGKDNKPLEGTKDEIKAWLDDNEVEYPSDALKDELIEILKDA